MLKIFIFTQIGVKNYRFKGTQKSGKSHNFTYLQVLYYNSRYIRTISSLVQKFNISADMW